MTLYLSPWPTLLAANLAFTAMTLIGSLHGKSCGLLWCFVTTVSCASLWFLDFQRESMRGQYFDIVWYAILLGFSLFILSEAFYFSGLFWCLISNMFSPTLTNWPPTFIQVERSWIPVIGTLLLIGSSFTATSAHHLVKVGSRRWATILFIVTITMGVSFIALECGEFVLNRFTISDSIYGSIVYMILGTHLSHVILGLVALSLCAYLTWVRQVETDRTTLIDCAVYYWHFVDLVWLVVVSLIYL